MKTLIFLLTAFLFQFGFTQNASAQNNLLWEISGNKLKKPSYLFGTIHFYNKQHMVLPDTLFRLIDRSEEVVFEANLATAETEMMEIGIMIQDTNQTLDKIISQTSYKQLISLCDSVPALKQMKGIIKNLKPFIVLAYLGMPADMNQMGSVDMELHQYASSKSKKTSGLETASEQMQSVNNMAMKDQAVLLEQAIADFPSRDENFQKMSEKYKKQQLELLLKEIQDYDSNGSMEDELLRKRNYLMADRAEKKLNEGAFIGVGAAHLVGEDGLVNILRSRGYILKPIEISIESKQ